MLYPIGVIINAIISHARIYGITLIIFHFDLSMASQISAFLASTQQRSQNPRRDCLYTSEEWEVLSKYKEEYKSLRTQEEREALLKGKIFVDMFNFWYNEEQSIPSAEECNHRIKVFLTCFYQMVSILIGCTGSL